MTMAQESGGIRCGSAVEQLLGVRSEILDQARERYVPTRVYVPYGPDWFRYRLRRLPNLAAPD